MKLGNLLVNETVLGNNQVLYILGQPFEPKLRGSQSFLKTANAGEGDKTGFF